MLAYLRSSTFEPLDRISLRLATIKTLFLVSLATAKRVGEVQALSKEVGFGRDHCIVSYFPEFIVETETDTNQLPRSFSIKVLFSLVGREEERKLCLVKALKFYMHRTYNFARQ